MLIVKACFMTLGRFALLLASMAFLTGAGLLVLGGFLSTYPILRQRPSRLRPATDAVATLAPVLARIMQERGASE